MVIYLSKKREVIYKILIFTLLFLFLYSLSYFISYIKYDNKEFILNSGLVVENGRLVKELEDISNVTYREGILGKVLYRDIYSFYDELVLNVGSNTGIQVNDAVIDKDSLIGIVIKVDKNTSRVKLLSSDYNISVKIKDTYGNLNNGIITMIDKYSDINIGDKVYTSGLDEIPSNIYIGKVSDISLDKDGLGKEVKIDKRDNTNLNYVYIVGKIK